MREIDNIDLIPVGIMRRALEDSGYGSTMASQALGWGKDSTRLRIALGLRPSRKGITERFVPYELACKMVKSWNLDPVDYGV